MSSASNHFCEIPFGRLVWEFADRDDIRHLSDLASLSLRLEKRGAARDQVSDSVVSVTSCSLLNESRSFLVTIFSSMRNEDDGVYAWNRI